MGDLDSNLNELDSLNLFYSAIEGVPDTIRHNCFKNLGYKEYIFLKFKVSIIENGVEKQISLYPDFLLWHEVKNLALIIEIKGENSLEEKHLKQLNQYREISLDQVQTRLRNIEEDPTIRINQIFFGIVYYDITLRNCQRSAVCRHRLNTLRQNTLVLTQNFGESLSALNPEYITFDDDLESKIQEGFSLLEYPPRNLYMTDNPCLKGAIWGIINYLDDEFFSQKISEIITDPLELKGNVFSYSRVKPRRLREALNILFSLNLCTREENQYIFNFEDLDDIETIRERIRNLNCERSIAIQQDIEDFL